MREIVAVGTLGAFIIFILSLLTSFLGALFYTNEVLTKWMTFYDHFLIIYGLVIAIFVTHYIYKRYSKTFMTKLLLTSIVLSALVLLFSVIGLHLIESLQRPVKLDSTIEWVSPTNIYFKDIFLPFGFIIFILIYGYIYKSRVRNS